MPFNNKLYEENKKYGAVTCSVCRQRKCTDWDIYRTNTFCSQECARKWINGAIDKANQHKARQLEAEQRNA